MCWLGEMGGVEGAVALMSRDVRPSYVRLWMAPMRFQRGGAGDECMRLARPRSLCPLSMAPPPHTKHQQRRAYTGRGRHSPRPSPHTMQTRAVGRGPRNTHLEVMLAVVEATEWVGETPRVECVSDSIARELRTDCVSVSWSMNP